MISLGVEDVLIDPDPDPLALRRALKLTCFSWELSVQRMEQALIDGPAEIPEEERNAVVRQHSKLLWEDIPCALMLHFPTINKHLAEDSHGVDRYRYVRRFQSKHEVLKATDDQGSPCVIKCLSKSEM